MSDTLIEEVNDELRRDKAAAALKTYGPYLFALCVLIILGAAGHQYWQREDRARAAEAHTQLRLAMDQAANGSVYEAEAALSVLSQTAPKAYSWLARFQAAQNLASTQPQDAVGIYDALSADGNVPDVYRHAATLKAAYLVLDAATVEDVKRRLEPLANSSSAFRHLAREIILTAHAKAGLQTEVERWLALTEGDLDTPPGMRQRLARMAEIFRAGRFPNGS